MYVFVSHFQKAKLNLFLGFRMSSSNAAPVSHAAAPAVTLATTIARQFVRYSILCSGKDAGSAKANKLSFFLFGEELESCRLSLDCKQLIALSLQTCLCAKSTAIYYSVEQK